MNERIKELAEQAKKYALDAMIKITDKEQALKVYSETYDTKFAELIVRECAQTLIDNTPVLDEYESQEDWDRGYGQAMRDCVHHIREHFGVKE